MPPKIEPEYQQVINEINARIADGRYQPGQRLPAIRELAEEYGTTVGTMRKATDLLKDRGVLVGRQGIRLFVASSPT